MMKFRVLLGCLILSGFMQMAMAQEAQVSFDANGKYFTVTQQIEKKVKLFSDYDGFREANLFQVDANSYILEVSYVKDGKLFRNRKPLTQSDFEELRVKFAASALFQEKTRQLKQDGRRHFLTTTTSWGAAFYGWAVPSSYNLGSRQTVGSWMLIGGTSFFVPFVLTKDSEISMSMAKATRYGAIASFFHTSAGYYAFTGDDGFNRGMITTSALVSIGEMAAFYQYAKHHEMSEGRVSAIGLYSSAAFIGGALGTYALSGDDGRFSAGLSLVGAGLGLVLGNHLTKSESYSVGDVRLSYATTFIGAYSVASIANIFSNNDDRLVAGSATIGAALGLWYAHISVQNYDFSESQGAFILYSTLAGWGTGLGAAYTFFGSLNESTLKPYAIISSLGAAAGYYVMFNYVKDDAKLALNEGHHLEWSINPLGIAAITGELNGNPSSSMLPMQAIRVKISF